MMLLMKTSKWALVVFSITLIALLVGACGGVTSMPTNAPALTAVSSTSTMLPIPSVTTTPLATNTATPTSSLPVPSAPDGLRMAFIIDGNLYFQDGSNPPMQLTRGDRDRSPAFSDDGEKIVFLRGLVPHNLYSISSDGSQERVLISGDTLSVLEGYGEFSELRSFAFIPGTHLLIFNTRELGELDIKTQDWNRPSSKNNDDLLVVDADTGEIKTILPPGKGGNFFISPDGNIIAVQAKGHIDLVNRDGQIIRQNLVTYTPTAPYELTPGVFWVDNSTELIVTLPVETEYNMDGPEIRSVWRCAVGGNARVQVSLTPPPIGDAYNISPDGNWILYNYYYYPGKTDETVTPGLYLGNLREGGARLYSPDIVVPIWSSDSIHFAYDGIFMGTIDSLPQPIGEGRLLGWGDAAHYLYFFNEMIVIGEVDGGAMSFPVGVSGSSIAGWPYLFTFIILDR